MNNKLVICGYGWLGRYLGEAMSATHSIVATTRNEEKALQISNKRIRGLVFSLGDDINALCEELSDATLVLNIPPGRRNTQLNDFTDSMLALINNAVAANVARIIFISTTSVYGDTRNDELNEHASTQPETASAKAHVAIEQHLLDLQTDAKVDVKIVRLAGLTGPDRHPINSLSGRNLNAGNKRINLVHIHDVVAALKTLILAASTKTDSSKADSSNGDTSKANRTNLYHLCSLQHPKRGDYYTQAANKKGIPAPTFSESDLTPTGKVIDAKASWDLLGIVPDYANPDDMV
ncbi:NAD-dependent epimerase/dehydratase family protein [Alteromonas sp. 1_MG-2023]|uniref:NAD-dependent epimerase/dehydratase family protein n=1 Tax=Alteromonas sp. 1_MG-2023 TaxID=3062669 RepID=UPI0026E164FB|nr:NAD-dependent epimerase/dehydratase family protein [Alteromonas sp. 1_MG-2023]MDO6568205.1 NAD-dependent epimerase/dehydratase family protein [Alteromonas sp. 1_MG-2023]